jgi:hypothetical protein
MTDKTYKCEECSKDIEVSWLRLMQLIDATYEMQTKNRKLVEFVKNSALLDHDEQQITEAMMDDNKLKQMIAVNAAGARDLLKEIGELEWVYLKSAARLSTLKS